MHHNNRFCQYSETAALKKVIVGRVAGYRQNDSYVEIVNEEQRSGLPDTPQLHSEFDRFVELLRSRGIEVLIPDEVGKFVYDQLTPRDIGITIGNRFVICNMKSSSRRYEAAGIFSHILEMRGPEPNILVPPDNKILLEGGDIIVDKQTIYVGLSQRTNQAGFEFLRSTFSDEFNVIAVQCRSLKEGENILHLDCAFNPVGENYALIYKEGFEEIPAEMEENYQWIEVTTEEQSALATNVLSLDEHTVVSRENELCERVNDEMRQLGLEVIELPFDAAPATGGSFRCCSLPLVRQNL